MVSIDNRESVPAATSACSPFAYSLFATQTIIMNSSEAKQQQSSGWLEEKNWHALLLLVEQQPAVGAVHNVLFFCLGNVFGPFSFT